MKTKTLRLILTLTAFHLAACQKEWLDAKSDEKLTIPSTLSDYQGLLDDVLSMSFVDNDLGEIASDGHFVNDAAYTSTPEGQRKDTYIWSKKGTYITEGEIDWQPAYKKILYCNIVLEGLSKFRPQDQAETVEMNDIKGQALFQRGITFFQIAQLFTPPYLSSDPDSEYGAILRLDTDITKVSKRASVKATYSQIINDLMEAEPLLPEKPKILTRGSKMAIYALLSRIYLCIGEYSKALDYAKKCLNIHPNLLEFSTLSLSATSIGLYNEEVIFHHCSMSSGFITYNCLFDSTFYNQYDINDLRRSILFSPTATGTFTFKGNYNDNTYLIFDGLATDEVILTKSECLARLGNVEEAMTDLNLFIKSRWDKNVEYHKKSATNKEEALRLVLEERKKSLLLRGTRWMDLRRLNKEGANITLKRAVAGQTYTLEPNSFKYAFPIPDVIITQTGIKQNPGWQ